ncbi:MAG TPA: D-glycero-beta-D-manno-heptose 1-phosphate adenylyltransferase [Trinickia sp.]|jgi:rfaE bifunctional protein nucleotidyltransferase chain/domain|nr:D-glycero-beta-D-manno-heptose 1-phosphate adenylyltransferase [Trinickia sp.]
MSAPFFERKIISREALVARRATLAAPVVFTNGVFDILHRGHVTYLAQAKALGACLIVGVNSDASVRMLGKGDDRPINREDDRMALLAALESVDWVVRFDEQTPIALIEAVRPDILVKGGDYDMDALPESVLVRGWGGRALAIAFEHERSTTALLKKVRAHGA